MAGAAQVPLDSCPVGMTVHMPREPDSAHDRQTPSQATLQHTPCAQTPEAHSPAAPQAVPTDLRPQLPPWQVLGAPQSASPAQVDLQLAGAAAQTNGAPDCAAITTPATAPRQGA